MESLSPRTSDSPSWNYCNKCGTMTIRGKEEPACDCSQGILAAEMLPGSTFRISSEVKEEMSKCLLSIAIVPTTKSNVDVGMLNQVNNHSMARVNVVDEAVSQALIRELHAAVNNQKEQEEEEVSDFVTRPWSLAASTMTSEAKFKRCFATESELIQMGSNPGSQFIDRLLGAHFKSLSPEFELQQCNALELVEHNVVLPCIQFTRRTVGA